MALTPDQLAQLQQYWAAVQANPMAYLNKPITIGGQTYGTMGSFQNDEGGQSYTPQSLIQYDPNNMKPGASYNVLDPATGNTSFTRQVMNGGSFNLSDFKDLGQAAAVLGGMYLGGQGLAAAGAGSAGGIGGTGIGAATGEAAGTAGTGMNFATGFTDTGTAGGAMDAGYAGSGAVAGAGGAAPTIGGEVSSIAPQAQASVQQMVASGVPMSQAVQTTASMFGMNPATLQSLLGAGASLAGGLISSNATTRAANTAASAQDRATQLQYDMFNRNKADVQPWVNTGKLSLDQLSTFMGLPGGNSTDPNFGSLTRQFGMSDFQADPGYQFRLQQGADMIKNQASALGGVNSGATLKSLSDYAQGQASSEYQNAYNRWNTTLNNIFSRLSGVAGTGANAAMGIAGIGTTVAGQAGANTANAGQLLGAGQLGSANALSAAITNAAPNIQSLFQNINGSPAPAAQPIQPVELGTVTGADAAAFW